MITKFTPFTFETDIPEAVGVDSAAIAAFEERIRGESSGHQGYMLYRKGKLVASSIAAPYRPTDKRHVYSISKSFTSTAVGIAVDEGLLSVEDSVISFFPDELPEKISDNLAAMKVKHLLSMNTGHHLDTSGRVATTEPGWVRRFLSLEVEHEPGSYFVYNSMATYMLSAIVTKLTGMRVIDYLRPRLFNPLGIEGVYCDESPDGINVGGWGFHVAPEDMLKLGVLYLNKGVWNGRRIVSEAWVNEATSYHSDNSRNGNIDWQQGYGYQFWRCQNNCFRGDGAYGQYIIVSPDKECVMVIISETNNLQLVMDIFWETIFASMADGPLPVGSACDTTAHPFMELPCGSADAPARALTLGANRLNIKNLTLTPGEGALMLTVEGEDRYASTILCGHGKWEYNRILRSPVKPSPGMNAPAIGTPADIAAAYATTDGTLRIALVFVDSPHGAVLELCDDKLTMQATLEAKAADVQLI